MKIHRISISLSASTVLLALTTTAAGVVLSSCASSERPLTTWGEETAITARAGAAELKTQPEFDAYAASILTASSCEKEARAMLEKETRSAMMMMRGCMRRPDFVSLLIFADQPWKAMKFTAADLQLLLDVSMRRGGIEVAEDLKSLGFHIEKYEIQRLEHPPGTKRPSLVAARVLVLKQAATPHGFINTVRLYGFENDVEIVRYRTYDFRTRTSKESSYSYGSGRSRNIVPLGLTLEVLSSAPLPKERRVQILARVDEKRSETVRLKAASSLAADLTPPGSLADREFRDPPAEAFAELVALEH